MDIFLNNEDLNFSYTKAHAIMWMNDGILAGNNKFNSIHFKTLSKKLDYLNKTLIINFSNIIQFSFEKSALQDFLNTLTDSTHLLLFINLPSNEIENIKQMIKGVDNQGNEVSNSIDKIHYKLEERSEIKIFLICGKNVELKIDEKFLQADFFETFEKDKIKPFISNIFEYYDSSKPLTSTAITSNGEFNGFKLISEPDKFIWVSLLLADIVKKKINFKQNIYTILSVSLRGSIFGGAVAGLCGININTIDHLGPKFKIFDLEFTEHIPDKNYIFIGDFVIGGTEIKISQAYVKTFGGNLFHAFSIGSMLKSDSYKSSFNLSSLYVLKDDFEFTKYSIEN